MRTTTDEIRLLYEEHDEQAFPSFGTMVNGLREHVDRIYEVCRLVWDIAPASVLDVGCNKGLFGALIRWGHGSVKRVVGVDISRLSCTHAKERMGYDEVHAVNASEYFELHEQFDLVLCMEIIEHVPDPGQVIRNVQAHMKEGGFAIFTCPVEIEPVDGEFHVRHVSAKELEQWIQQEGLHIRHTDFLRSHFCEKPRWQGWTFVVATKGRM